MSMRMIEMAKRNTKKIYGFTDLLIYGLIYLIYDLQFTIYNLFLHTLIIF